MSFIKFILVMICAWLLFKLSFELTCFIIATSWLKDMI